MLPGFLNTNLWLVEFVDAFIFDVFGDVRGRRTNIRCIFWESQKNRVDALWIGARNDQNIPNLKSGCSGVLIHVWYREETILWLVEMTQQNRVPLPTSNCRARWWRGCQGVKRNLAITQPPPKLNVWFATDVFQAASTGSPGVCSLGSIHKVSTSCFCMFQKGSINCQSVKFL